MLRSTIVILCALATLVVSISISTSKCGPVCAIYCLYGNVFDDKGCPTCKCRESPCKSGLSPLKGYFCGRGVNRTDCPTGYKCVIALTDAYAVCCPCKNQATTKI